MTTLSGQPSNVPNIPVTSPEPRAFDQTTDRTETQLLAVSCAFRSREPRARQTRQSPSHAVHYTKRKDKKLVNVRSRTRQLQDPVRHGQALPKANASLTKAERSAAEQPPKLVKRTGRPPL